MKDKADEVRRKEDDKGEELEEEADETKEEDDAEGGEVERLVDVAEISSAEASDSEVGSGEGSAMPSVGMCSWACCCSRADMLATQKTPSPSWSCAVSLTGSGGHEDHTGRASQQRWMITC